MKKLYFLIALLCSFTQLRAQYYWQITEITSISNGGTYDFGTTAENIQLNVYQCAGGINKPHNSTAYTIKWYANTADTNSGGTLINSYRKNTGHSYPSTIQYTPPTNTEGTFYYYAVLTNPSKSTCGFLSTDSLVSPTVKVTVNPPVLNIDEVNTYKSNISLYPNPTKEFVSITNLENPTRYSIYNFLGTEISNGITSSNEKINIANLSHGMYYLKFENGNILEFVKN